MITAQGLTKYYGAKLAIDNVSFHIDRGEIVGLLGPNGAGKTTVLRILTCFMPPTHGKALIHGLDILTHGLEARKRIGFLPENVPLYHELSVIRFLSFAGMAKGLNGESLSMAIGRVIDLCGLQEHSHRLIKHLSKGLRQRVGLAQALVGDPPILILDEPTTGLDPAQIIEMRRLIKELGSERTVLLSSHILPEVSQLCNRVIIMNKGKIIAQDTQEGLMARISGSGRRTILLVDGKFDQVKGILESIEGVRDVRKGQRPGEIIVEGHEERSLRPFLAKAVVEAGLPLMEMRSMDVSLEEVFVHLVTEEVLEANGGKEGERHIDSA